jgi:hypothetical protein
MAPDLPKIIEGTVLTLREIDGIGDVNDREGGMSTWSASPKPKQSYWIIDHEQTQVRVPGVSLVFPAKTSNRHARITVDGWMPWSFSGLTGQTFRNWIDTVLVKITSNLTLGVCAKMVSLPELEFNKLEIYSSLNQGDVPVFCHHCRIAFTISVFYPVFGIE